jgi:hypothetical protein
MSHRCIKCNKKRASSANLGTYYYGNILSSRNKYSGSGEKITDQYSMRGQGNLPVCNRCVLMKRIIVFLTFLASTGIFIISIFISRWSDQSGLLKFVHYLSTLFSVGVGLFSIFILSYAIIYAVKDRDDIRDEIAVDYKSHTDKYYAYFTPKQYHKMR